MTIITSSFARKIAGRGIVQERNGLFRPFFSRNSGLGATRFTSSTSDSDIDVEIVEVGPRDGLQNEPTLVSARDKIELIRQLTTEAKLRRIEVGAFVSPKWVPQMATTEDVLAGLASLLPSELGRLNQNNVQRQQQHPHYSVLVPNLKGLSHAMPFFSPHMPEVSEDSPIKTTTTTKASTDALQGGGVIKEIAIFASASEGFSQRNLACSIQESLDRFRDVAGEALTHSTVKIRGYVSCVVACPYDGPTSPSQVARVTESLLDLGCYEVSLGDTIGVGTAGTIRRMIQEVQQSVLSSSSYSSAKMPFALHCHDTYGQALANILVGLEEGISTFDSSVAGLGGCPYAKGASGNVATEDVVYMM